MANVSPQSIYGYLIQRGVSPASAAGILSNIQAESSFDSAAVGDRGASVGLFQHNRGRANNLRSFASQTGRSWSDWTAQVDFALMEAQQMGINLRSSDPVQASREWTLRFERPANAQQRADERARMVGRYIGFTDPGGGGSDPYGFPGGFPPGGGFPTTSAPVSGSLYDILNAQLQSQNLTGALQTQLQRQYAGQQASLERQLLGLGATQNRYDLEALEVERRYQQSIQTINRDLNSSERQVLDRQFTQLGHHTRALESLAAQGLANSKEYYSKSQDLEKEILATTRTWLSKQAGFNREDYDLALGAIRNIVTTETARWREIQRLTPVERRNATADMNQRLKVAQFTEDVQRRGQISEATARGALSARGHGAALGEFAQQRQLEGTSARNQLNRELEAINQGYNAGQISYQDAVRQTQNATARAGLTFRQGAAQLGFQGQQAGIEYRGASLQNLNQLRNAEFAYRGQHEDIWDRWARGKTDYAGSLARLRAQNRENAAAAALQGAMYPINRAGLLNTGRRYGIQGAQIGAQLSNTRDLLQLQLGQMMLGQPPYQSDFSGFNIYGGGFGGYGGGFGPGTSTRTPAPRPRTGIYTPPASTSAFSAIPN